MGLEDFRSHRQRAQDVDLGDEAVLLLLPVKWNAAANLHEAEDVLLRRKYSLRLDKVATVGVVIDAAANQPDAAHRCAPPRENCHFDVLNIPVFAIFPLLLFLILLLAFVLVQIGVEQVNSFHVVRNVALDSCQGPERIDLLEVEVPQQSPVPNVPDVHVVLGLLIVEHRFDFAGRDLGGRVRGRSLNNVDQRAILIQLPFLGFFRLGCKAIGLPDAAVGLEALGPSPP